MDADAVGYTDEHSEWDGNADAEPHVDADFVAISIEDRHWLPEQDGQRQCVAHRVIQPEQLTVGFADRKLVDDSNVFTNDISIAVAVDFANGHGDRHRHNNGVAIGEPVHISDGVALLFSSSDSG
jgi:hypothetical protein